VNNLGKVVGQLNTTRSQGSPWQQTAIDRINPMLREMADQLTETIKFLTDHKAQVNMPPYQDYARANYDLASRTARTISDFVEYSKSKGDAQELQRRLELPASAEHTN